MVFLGFSSLAKIGSYWIGSSMGCTFTSKVVSNGAGSGDAGSSN